jgi:hypothetical protein
LAPRLALQRVAAKSLSGRDGVDDAEGDGKEKPQAQSSSKSSTSRNFLSMSLPQFFYLDFNANFEQVDRLFRGGFAPIF